MMNRITRGLKTRVVAAGLLASALVGIGGCTIEAYNAPPPRYYYQTRVYYTPNGPVYVRERVYYQPSQTVVVNTPVPGSTVPPPSVTAPAETPTSAALQPLVAPIALYADPLIAV